jgi:purine-binding chemotaxis protein CheW
LHQLFVVRLDDHRYALPLQDVERVLRMVEITALPEAPPTVLGVVNVQGRVLSVIDLRSCFHLPQREVIPEDILVIVHAAGGMVALAVDAVEGVSADPESTMVTAGEIVPEPAYLEGVAKLADDLVLICDLEQLLASDRQTASGAGHAS